MTDSPTRYALSFTSGTLLMQEAAVVAPIYLEERDWVATRARVVERNLLQTRAGRSNTRTLGELLPRLQTLNDQELEVVADGLSAERRHLLWAAACRRYRLIAEFAEEVLRERFLTLAGSVSYDEFDAFYRGKALWHDELDKISASSYQKLRQVLFKMMVEAGVLAKEGGIQHVLLSERVACCLRAQTPSDIRFFPTREAL
jgi:hypothetical protein